MDVKTAFLTDEEAERLYRTHPHLAQSPDDYCPTCDKRGTYKWRGKVHECDCQEQLQLTKIYTVAGIGAPYQRLDWDDVEDDTLVDQIKDYVLNPEYVRRGRGLLISGENGVGKTLLGTLCLKDMIKSGRRGFAITFAKMVSLYTAGWRSDEERRWFNTKILDTEMLLLDDIGRELREGLRGGATRLSEATFDDVLRTRVNNGWATIITTNLSKGELGDGYGSAVLSLLREKSMGIEVSGGDWRTRANNREQEEIDRGETRPIR